MKILVTGGAGFIGSHIVELFQDQAEEIRVLDNLRSGFLHNIAPFKHTFIEGSIMDKAILRKAMEGVDYVFHLAAMISVPESMSAPEECRHRCAGEPPRRASRRRGLVNVCPPSRDSD